MKIKILIVDDSRIFRSAVEELLSREKDIEVVGSVWNGIKALEFIKESPPHLVTLDIQMPDMDGLETLEEIQNINATRGPAEQIGVIMLSSHTQKGADITVQALEMGAFDFIAKPESRNLRDNIAQLCRQLVVKIRNYASIRIPNVTREQQKPQLPAAASIAPRSFTRLTGFKAIMIGVSTGGPQALAELLPPLCAQVDVPIFIVQHMPPTFTQSLAKSLNNKCRYEVVEAGENEYVQDRHVYIAPGGRHMLLEVNQQKIRTVINDQPPEKGCRPSVDVLFRSGAAVYGSQVLGVILTGMGTDGTEGGKELKSKGGVIIAQDEESSVVWGMPGSAKNAGIVDEVLPLKEIPEAVISMVNRSVLP
ncbi:MAG: protein-glutamate methylesterase/protein-glutamine glutaminase [Desulfobulbaceae bacterium]